MTGGKGQEPEVLFDRRGRLGHILLNRPGAINALTHGMVRAIHDTLDEWAEDASVETVLLTGSGERGLCAGGDIVSLYRDAREGDGSASAAFWRDEYRLNARIASYPKPYVAIMDGLVLGGGIGLSAHGSHRVVTERSKIGMPETGIGFVPDVGGTWLLAHAPGELGTHLALTAGSVRGADAIITRFADTFVPSERLDELILALESTGADAAIAAVAGTAPESDLLRQKSWIDEAFSADSVAEIVDRLRAGGSDLEQRTADAIASKSPMALAIALESLRRARRLPSLEAALAQEYRVSLRVLRMHDFVEGIRAQVIEKDRQPQWQPAQLDVDPALVTDFFAPLGEAELEFSDAAQGTSVGTR